MTGVIMFSQLLHHKKPDLPGEFGRGGFRFNLQMPRAACLAIACIRRCHAVLRGWNDRRLSVAENDCLRTAAQYDAGHVRNNTKPVRISQVLFPAIAFILLMTGCSQAGSPPAEAARNRSGRHPESYAYVLQADKIASSRKKAVQVLAACDRDWIILDSSYGTGPAGRWTRDEIRRIRAGKPRRKVIAYLSIGEAETYRSYWQQSWDRNRDGKPDRDAPGFLMNENPEWKGNYRVRYWDAGWQRIAGKELDRIIDQGFDGVWLDVVDVFEFFEKKGGKYIDNRVNKATGNTFRKDMILFVCSLAAVARRSAPGFLVIPQNGSQLLADPGYQQVTSAIALEDLFTNGKRKQPRSHTTSVIKPIFTDAGWNKPVLDTEYCRRPGLRQFCRKQAGARKIILLFTGRELDRLGTASR